MFAIQHIDGLIYCVSFYLMYVYLFNKIFGIFILKSYIFLNCKLIEYNKSQESCFCFDSLWFGTGRFYPYSSGFFH